MPSIRSVLLLAATAAAEVTTTLWMPVDDYSFSYSSSDDYVEKNFTASAIGKSGGNITMAIAPTATSVSTLSSTRIRTITRSGYTSSVTWINDDRWKYESVYSGYDADTTYSSDCSIATASMKAVCVESVAAADMYDYYCGRYTSSAFDSEATITTRTYTFDTVTVTEVSTRSIRSYTTPSFCLSGSTLPESYYKSTRTYRAQPYQVVITAGEEKLSATTGASPTGSGSQPTGPGAQGGSSGNAAHPMITAAPGLIGFGAAAAAMFL